MVTKLNTPFNSVQFNSIQFYLYSAKTIKLHTDSDSTCLVCAFVSVCVFGVCVCVCLCVCVCVYVYSECRMTIQLNIIYSNLILGFFIKTVNYTDGIST